MRSGRVSFLALLAAGTVLAGPTLGNRRDRGSPPPAAAEAEKSPLSTSEELRFVELANKERAQRNLRQLAIDPLLITVARQHSQEMMEKNYFNHFSPTPGIKTPMDRYLKGLGFRPAYACVGENLFYCSVTDVERGHQAFMNSPAHRENLLYPQYERIGVGIQHNAKGEFWVTEMFLANSAK
jgi:uncharacterized protein YkwD